MKFGEKKQGITALGYTVWLKVITKS